MIFRYILLIILGAVIAVLLYFIFHSVSLEKKLDVARQDLNNCLHAPVHIDTVWDTIKIQSNEVFKPTPLPKKPPVQASGTTTTETVSVNQESVCTQRYDQIYLFPGGSIRWNAYIKNCIIEEMSFPQIVAPKEIITITKVVDTCYRKDEEAKKLKNQLWLYAKPKAMFPFYIVDVTVGVQWQVKQKWGVGMGVGYDWKINSPIVEGVLLLNLK